MHRTESGKERILGHRGLAFAAGERWSHFWHGIIHPSRKEIDVALQELGRLAEKVFPLRFASEDARVSGSLTGFVFLDRGSWTEQPTV